MNYIYNDEDNAPMNDDFLGPHNPTVYLSRAEMKAAEAGRQEPEEKGEGTDAMRE